MRNAFKVFDGLEKKKTDTLVNESIEIKVKDKKGYTHIPPEAFRGLFGYEENNHLMNGLYVANNHHKVGIKSEKIILENIPDYYYKKGHLAESIDWYTAQQIVYEKGSKMMTPAEFLAIDDHIRDGPLFESMRNMRTHIELLDGFMQYEDTLNTHYNHEEITHKIEFPEEEMSHYYFNYHDVESHTGIPKTLNVNENSRFEFVAPVNYNHAVSWYNDTEEPTLCFHTLPRKTLMRNMTYVFRECKKVKKSDIL